MKKALIIFSAIIMMAAFSTNLMAQPGNSASATANATVMTALTLTNVNPLNFAAMTVPYAATASVAFPAISTGNGTELPTNVYLLTVGGNVPTVASFNVSGNSGSSYTITLPTSSITITTAGGGWPKQMNVDTWNSAGPNFTTTNTSTIQSTGTDNFYVGATLEMTYGTSQSTGLYTGTFNITVNYN